MKNNLDIKNSFLKFGEFQKIDNNTKEFDPRQIKSLDPSSQSIHLTFDMCPTKELELPIIEYLIKNKINATFFINVKWLENNSDKDLSFMKNPLFSIGGHGFNHIDPMKESDDEQNSDIDKCLEFWKDKGIEIKWYRVPHGHPTENVLNYFEDKGLKCASWKGPVFDKKSKYTHYNPNEVAKHYIDRSLKSGDILIMHANGEGDNTLDILKMLVKKTKDIGLGFSKLV